MRQARRRALAPTAEWTADVLVEVDPSGLGDLARRLAEGARVAQEVCDGARSLKGLADRAGDPSVSTAISSFLERWRHGCGCLAGNACRVAERLERTSRLYVEVEERISETFPRET